MRFSESPLSGVWVIDVEPIEDERGLFARTFARDEFEEHGLSPDVVHCSVSYNRAKGTLRGLHYQAAPHAEEKLVRVSSGSIFDVALDVRSDSPTYLAWHAVELSAENRRALYLSKGIAHGFLTLADSTEVVYQMSAPFVPEASRRLRWDDPAFGIQWPGAVKVISDPDRLCPMLDLGAR